MFDGHAFGQEIVAAVKGYVDPLIERIAVLEQRLAAFEALDGVAAVARREAEAAVFEVLNDIPTPAPGEPGAKGDPGPPGPGVTPEELAAAVAVAVAALPPAPPGPKGDPGEPGAKGDPGRAATVDEVLAALPPLPEVVVPPVPVSMLINRAGELVCTYSDGGVATVGPVVGRDGKSVTPEEVAALVAAAVAEIPKPKDGRDGLGFDDLEMEFDGERAFAVRFQRGADVKAFPFTLPNTIYRDVFDDAREYQPGDLVTWAGSIWHCNKPCRGVIPGAGAKDWTLAVKRGQPGKDGVAINPPGHKVVKS